MYTNKQMIKMINTTGKKAKGQNFIIRHLEGKILRNSEKIKAKCYDCMGYYVDGKVDCGVTSCPLHPYMPYRNVKRTNIDEEKE